MTMPSRQFLIGQAILNVHSADWWKGYITIVDNCKPHPCESFVDVKNEFHRLEKLYQAINGEVF